MVPEFRGHHAIKPVAKSRTAIKPQPCSCEKGFLFRRYVNAGTIASAFS